MGSKNCLPKFKKEELIRAKGGELQKNFEQTRLVIVSINETFLPYLQSLGFTDLEDILTILLSNDIVSTARRIYSERIVKSIESEETELSDVLPFQAVQRIEGEGKTRYHNTLAQELNKVISLRLRRAEYKYLSSTDSFSTSSLSRPLELFREAITLSPSGLALDVPKFIEIYTRQDDEQYIRKQSERHKNAAEAINRFFGDVKITRKELLRYFSIVDDRIEPNPNFSTKEAYLKLREKGKKRAEHGIWQ